jgi:hypothetical protein
MCFSGVFQMEGEMQLCLYEALAHVCNALAVSVDIHSLSMVRHSVNLGGAKDDKLLDSFVFNLQNNVNALLHAHTLARSRKSFLLQQKVKTILLYDFVSPLLTHIICEKKVLMAFKPL